MAGPASHSILSRGVGREARGDFQTPSLPLECEGLRHLPDKVNCDPSDGCYAKQRDGREGDA